MNNQFKIKPDKNKYLSNVDTLDSTHKKIIEEFERKRYDLDKKIIKLSKLKNELDDIDNKYNEFGDIPNYIELRAKLIDDISNLEDEIKQINNYEDETEYYSKTYQILFNYYDILDGQIESEINGNNCILEDDSKQIDNGIDFKNNDELITENLNQINTNNNINNNSNKENYTNNNVSNNHVDEWELDGVQIFNSFKKSRLDTLNELAKKNKKEKKTTRRRVKNVESLVQNNNYDIFEFINSGNKTNLNAQENANFKTNEYSVFDRAQLYDDYKITLEGYNSKKKYCKMCNDCGIEKVLIYSEGIYACLNCGEVENCIIENEVTNYKEPMVEKPTFPYKRKNHFCEWTYIEVFKVFLFIIASLKNQIMTRVNMCYF